MSNIKVHFSSASNEWDTPQWLFDHLDKKYKFELDPATSGSNAKCDKYYTEEDDGLAQDWHPHSVFCNPPYGRVLGNWCKKAYEESLLSTKPIVLLIPARTDTVYWHKYIFNKADSIYFIKGRIKFGDSKNSAPFPSAIVVYNDTKKYIGSLDLDKFRK